MRTGSSWMFLKALSIAPFVVALAGLAALTGLSGCSDPEEAEAVEPAPEVEPEVDCSVPAQNERLLALMKDAYLWYDKVPDVDPAAYDSPRALLDDLVFADIDRWSSIVLKEVSAAYYGEGRRVGLGFRTRFDVDDTLRLSLIYAGSPADDAKLQRGDRVLAINNKTIDEIEAQDLWATVLGPEEEGVDVTMKIERLGGAVEDIAMEKRVYEFETTHTHRVFSHAGKTVGYLLFDRFLSTSGAELEAVFASFKQAGVDELVLDLRYNGGGLIDVAHHLGSLIAANPSEGELFTRVLHNDKHPNWNTDQLFIKQKNGLDLQRIFIIATGATASSSELLINGLFPHIEVRLIGEATYGKPVGSGAWTDCDLVIRPISFRLANAEGRADYFNGLSPDCFAEDDIDLPLGDETEASLAEALHFMSYGSCSLHAGPIDLAAEEGRARRTIPWRGLDAEIDAF